MSNGHSNHKTAPCAACGDIDGCHLPGHRAAEIASKTDEANGDLQQELAFARKKFPSATNLLTALVEESGELARELLQNGNTAHARKEAIQVACVAMRIATEGAVEFDKLTKEERQP